MGAGRGAGAAHGLALRLRGAAGNRSALGAAVTAAAPLPSGDTAPALNGPLAFPLARVASAGEVLVRWRGVRGVPCPGIVGEQLGLC